MTETTHDDNEQAATTEPARNDLYARLSTPFDVTFRDLRGGVELESLMARGERQANGCLFWNGSRVQGYGNVKSGGKTVKVHRRVFELTRGVRLTPEVKVRHTCDNPPCYEPTHLLAGTQAQNVQDRVERGRSSRQGNPKTSEQQRAEIAARYHAGEPPTALAREFGLDRTRIWQIGRAS